MAKEKGPDPLLHCDFPPFSVYGGKLIGPVPPELTKLQEGFRKALEEGKKLIFIDIRGAEHDHPPASSTKKIHADVLAEQAWFWRFLKQRLLRDPQANGFSVLAEGPDEEWAMHRGSDNCYRDLVDVFSRFRRHVINLEEGDKKDREELEKKVVIVSRDSAPVLRGNDEEQFLSKLRRLPQRGVDWEWLKLDRVEGVGNLYQAQVHHVLTASTKTFRELFEHALMHPRSPAPYRRMRSTCDMPRIASIDHWEKEKHFLCNRLRLNATSVFCRCYRA